MNIKPSMQLFPLSNTTHHMKKYCNSRYLGVPHSALQISHKYTGVFYTRVVSPFSTLNISKLSRKSGIFFHTHTGRFYHKCFSAVVSSLSHVRVFCDPKDRSLAGSSVHGILQARYWSRRLPCPSPGTLPDPGTAPGSPARFLCFRLSSVRGL